MKRDNGRGSSRSVAVISQGNNRSIMNMVHAIVAGLSGSMNVFTPPSSKLVGRSERKKCPAWRKYGHHPHCGDGEQARRRRQIARGQLTPDNGLIFNEQIVNNKVKT